MLSNCCNAHIRMGKHGRYSKEGKEGETCLICSSCNKSCDYKRQHETHKMQHTSKASYAAGADSAYVNVLTMHQENPDGLTDDQLFELLGDERRDTWKACRNTLYVNGYLEETKQKQVTRLKREAIVWQVTEKGLETDVAMIILNRKPKTDRFVSGFNHGLEKAISIIRTAPGGHDELMDAVRAEMKPR